MSTDNTARDTAPPPENGPDPRNSDVELDHAIDELRGVLKKGADGPAAGTADAAGKTGTAKADEAFSSMGFDDMSTSAAKAFSDFSAEAPASPGAPAVDSSDARLDLIMDIPIEVQVVLGSTRMPVASLMKLSQGSTIALERRIGEAVEIVVNGRVIGRGEITVMDDDETRFGVRIIEVETDKD